VPLQLEVLQANDGDCFLLHTGAGTILIDGGSGGVYKSVLKKRLEELRAKKPQLDLRLAMCSHIDADHITGVLDMFRDLAERQDNGEEPRYQIASLWHNSFAELAGKAGGKAAAVESSVVGASLSGSVPKGLDWPVEAVVASVKQGNDLRGFAKKLRVPINPETKGDLVKAPAKGKRVIKFGADLTFTILGPHEAELDALEESWEHSKSKKRGASEAAVAADYLNRTVPNLSSIVVLAEAKGAKGKTRRLLLPGDTGGDLILEGLKTAGFLDKKGAIHVDLLKVQHHGSNHSVDIDFFRKVTADQYVISGNGKHGIPHKDTLGWLSEARSGEEYDVYLSNRKGTNGLTKMLTTFLASEAKNEKDHRYHFRENPALSIPVDV
jgi:beta-lactamase superfamily II metal-dependent hydrolase